VLEQQLDPYAAAVRRKVVDRRERFIGPASLDQELAQDPDEPLRVAAIPRRRPQDLDRLVGAAVPGQELRQGNGNVRRTVRGEGPHRLGGLVHAIEALQPDGQLEDSVLATTGDPAASSYEPVSNSSASRPPSLIGTLASRFRNR